MLICYKQTEEKEDTEKKEVILWQRTIQKN